jgi:hypothetical protein
MSKEIYEPPTFNILIAGGLVGLCSEGYEPCQTNLAD